VINDKKIIAVIPARGGSVGVPGKNIRDLNGKPLISYTAEQVSQVPEIDKVVVSTDSPAIKKVSEGLGLCVIDRPAALATSEASTESALLHVLDELQEQGESYDYIVVLEPTSPFRSAATIRNAIQDIISSSAPSLLAVTETRNVIGQIEGGFFKPWVAGERRRRQDREPKYVEASTIYVCRVDYLRQTGTLVSDQWRAFIVPENEALDINTPLDFHLAELVISEGENND